MEKRMKNVSENTTLSSPMTEFPELNNWDEFHSWFVGDILEATNTPELSHIQNPEIRREVKQLIAAYRPKPIKTSPIQLKITLSDDRPIHQRARRLAQPEKETVETQIKEWLRNGIIQNSSSDYAVPVVVVAKKDGSKRVCVDYRPINKRIIKDRYPLPNIDEQIDALQGARIYTTLDLENGFFHIPVAEDSRKYTSFITTSGQYEFLKAPFGLCLCPPVFQRFINTIFAKLIDEGVMLVYMDDMIIPAINEQEALIKLKRVLQVAEQFNLNIKWKKCEIMQTKIEFLGFEIEKGTIRASSHKTRAVTNYQKPRTTKEIQRFLGLTGYFRRFIRDYALIPMGNSLR